MNKRQHEVEKAKLAAEARELKTLKAMYKEAADQIANNIRITDGKMEVLLSNWDDLSDDDKSVYQSKIYQRNFQKQLQNQINDVLKDLNSGQYKSIDEYLKKCYETGYIGTMYDIAGQGIPIISPIDQKKVVKAIRTNSKISGGLYAKLGKDVGSLQKRIANSISRGIATSDSYENIARNIANDSNVGFNNAMRIARTEGHRIHSNSAFDAQLEAKAAGADIVKQWNSTMDGKTRPHHRLLDGQIREVEEPFEMGGMKAMYPSDFGRPEEDINCRCVILQRAKWALDEDELEVLKERAAYYGLDKTDSLNDFKKKYLKAVDDIPSYKANMTGGLKKYTEKELKALTKEMDHIANKHIGKTSKWSGKLIINDFVATWGKLWNCNILTKTTTAPQIILHEHLHARSISLYGKKKGQEVFDEFRNIEEATVQLMTQEICKTENIVIIKSAYDGSVDILRQINKILKISDSDYEFGKKLIDIPVSERIDWLEDTAYNIFMSRKKNVSTDDFDTVNDLIDKLR